MEAKDILLMVEKDQDLLKDLGSLGLKTNDQVTAMVKLVMKITNLALEKQLQKLGLLKEKKQKVKPTICFRCQEKGHLARNCKNSVKCKYCAKEHFTRECPDRICQTCKKKHPKNQCPKANSWCKWCRIWNKHATKDCPNGGILKRLTKLEKLSIPPRPRSLGRFKMFRGLGRGAKRGMRLRGGLQAKKSQLGAKDAQMSVD